MKWKHRKKSKRKWSILFSNYLSVFQILGVLLKLKGTPIFKHRKSVSIYSRLNAGEYNWFGLVWFGFMAYQPLQVI